MGQPTPGVPVYTVKSVAGDRTRVLHRNLLLPLQGRIRQEGGMRGEGISGSEDEEEEGDEMPKVARAPCGSLEGPPDLKQVPHSRGRPLVRMPQVTCLNRKLTPCWLVHPPKHMSGDEDSSKDEVYTYSFTSHTTASGSTTADLLTPSAFTVEDNSHVQPLNISPTEGQFMPDIPYLEECTKPDQTTDSVLPNSPLILILAIVKVPYHLVMCLQP